MDDAREIAEEMVKRHSEWDSLVAKSEKKWLAEYKKLLSQGERFWGTTFATYTSFKVFEHAFSDMIDECYAFAKKDDPDHLMTRKEVAYGLFGEVVESSDSMELSFKSGAEA